MTLRQAAQTSEVPAPAGPYSPAVRIGSIATSAGHGGATPDETMPDDISGQVGQALRNVLASLAAVGASAGDVAQIRVYLTEREHFAPMNQVYKTFFEELPAGS
jgi:2-iminobutanoate/2-iminopropanoate deaminase